MLERIGAVSIIIGTILGAIGFWWLIVRTIKMWIRKTSRTRLRAPIALLLISSLMTGLPIAINSALTRLTSLGPLESIVDGERHVTLTGWNRHDYSVVASRPDTIVLQMANPDVTDDTMKYVANLNQLRELDLSNSQVTDATLEIVKSLPKLRDLRLARTKITDDGFRQHLLEKESLSNLDLSGTSVASKTVREWKAEATDRKALK